MCALSILACHCRLRCVALRNHRDGLVQFGSQCHDESIMSYDKCNKPLILGGRGVDLFLGGIWVVLMNQTVVEVDVLG